MAQAQLNSPSDSLDEETQLDDEVRPPDPPFSDGTFRTTPRPWKQNFIISAKVTSSVFVPVVFVLLPDKKRDSYDAMFSLLAEILESQGLEMSATYFMSGTILFQLNFV